MLALPRWRDSVPGLSGDAFRREATGELGSSFTETAQHRERRIVSR
ncbi:hypothetical protein EYF80_061601 [Liparis tanakae]|uniref:Uncharacterized protein n=1 Tax=Liparis tanakae TaxID=230148 RepID=A0A4Z2EI51_9TELE|nr:hypothetical protein EYF80_061601 [Liparis tanakae]